MLFFNKHGKPRQRPDCIRVLVAEDDALVLDALTTIIGSDEDFNVVGTAHDADSAIAGIIASAPDLVLLDVRMPGGGGERVAQSITVTRPAVRIVAISAHDDEHTIETMIAAGAHGYVTKDSTPQKILDTLKRVASGETIFTPITSENVVRKYAQSSQRLKEERQMRRTREERVRKVCEPGYMTSVFQPIVDIRNGEVVMYEALTRFDPMFGMNPQQWFEEAEELGMSSLLESTALTNTATALTMAGADDITVSLNVSPGTLLDPEMANCFLAFTPDRMVVEITEHARINDYGQVKAVAEKLHDRGTRLAIDDAGAGFASLRHILDLNPDLIKLDISLVRSVDTDQARHALAAGLTTFAKEIGAEIVAEGIETREELETLCDLGVHYGQGYYLARPAPLEELMKIEISV
ncbi:MAG: EAL domain-containing protein [Solirubrobacterales bacterium]